MKHIFTNWRVTVFGLLSWVVPFVVSIPFFSGPGELRIPLPLFRSLMVVIAGGVGVLLLVWVFRHIRPTLASGLAIGGYWVVIDWVLDMLILLPIAGMDFSFYVQDIGIRYLLILIIAGGMGVVAQRSG